ncbi:hypothetical protein GIB67_035896 [Kingdonia uniflora]|uniref:Uncharacterized protein n=1 Tax=Kingdonia uniflora TaxID=39325 RepID=A0A7J7P8M9_9MAGN|nr:hypothetical protein GIB67_035896 [Kingdonia uniflora]
MKKERGRPKGSVKRTELFFACHKKQDGTFPGQMKSRMEYGEDGNGHVRGFSGHINKASVRVTFNFRKAIERENSKNNKFADEIVSVQQEFEEKLEVKASKRRRLEERIGTFESREGRHGINMHHASPSNVSFFMATRDSPPLDGVRSRNCIMKDMYGRTVAYGSIQLSGVAPEGFYRVIVDEVIRDDVQLFMKGGTLGDISSGETIIWYKSLTCFG